MLNLNRISLIITYLSLIIFLISANCFTSVFENSIMGKIILINNFIISGCFMQILGSINVVILLSMNSTNVGQVNEFF